jgi:hypothetical protein
MANVDTIIREPSTDYIGHWESIIKNDYRRLGDLMGFKEGMNYTEFTHDNIDEVVEMVKVHPKQQEIFVELRTIQKHLTDFSEYLRNDQKGIPSEDKYKFIGALRDHNRYLNIIFNVIQDPEIKARWEKEQAYKKEKEKEKTEKPTIYD